MKLIRFFLLVIFAFSIQGNAQNIDGDNFTIEIIKAKINKINLSTSKSDISLPKGVERLQVRIRIISKSKKRELFNPNAFSIVSQKHKRRYRPIDVKYALFHGFANFMSLEVDVKIEDVKTRYVRRRIERTKDVFLEYIIKDYKNMPMIIDYGTKKKPRNESIYFASEKYSNKTIDFYFGVHSSNKTVDLYYRDQKVKTITIN